MILIVNDNSVSEINKALLSIRDEIESLKREVAQIKGENK